MKFKIPFINCEINIPFAPIDKLNEAKEINNKATADFNNAKERVEEKRCETRASLESLIKLQLNVFDTSLRKFVSLFERIKNVDLTPIQSQNEFVHRTLNVVNLSSVEFNHIDTLKTVIASGGSGALVGGISFSAIGYLGTASTGAAISGLSGAAWTNATLAWLGGGSIASGGGGVAVGSAVLGGLVAIPALLVGGLILNAKAKEALNNANSNKAIVEKFISETYTAISAMNAIISRSSNFSSMINKIDDFFQPQLDNLENIITKHSSTTFISKVINLSKLILSKVLSSLNLSIPNWIRIENKVNYNKFAKDEKEQLMVTVGLAQTLKNLIDTDLLDKDGILTSNSEKVLIDARRLIEK